VACRGDVELAMESALSVGPVEVHLILCVSGLSADSVLFHSGMEGSRTFGFEEALPGVLVSQPSPCYAQETQHPASCLLGPLCVVS